MLKEEVQIVLEDVTLDGNLVIPDSPKGLVIFSHGSGSSRFSPRNNYVARLLQQNGMATLLFDLLTRSEDMLYENRFDIDRLTQRLIETTQWVKGQKDIHNLALGYFGASTGAASALRAAAFFWKWNSGGCFTWRPARSCSWRIARGRGTYPITCGVF